MSPRRKVWVNTDAARILRQWHFKRQKGSCAMSPVLDMESLRSHSQSLSFSWSAFFTWSWATVPSCNAVSRNRGWLVVATKPSLQERDYYQAEAKIEVFCCVWFNGNVEDTSQSKLLIQWVLRLLLKLPLVCYHSVLPFGKDIRDCTSRVSKRFASELFNAFYKGWLDPEEWEPSHKLLVSSHPS